MCVSFVCAGLPFLFVVFCVSLWLFSLVSLSLKEQATSEAEHQKAHTLVTVYIVVVPLKG